jgi:CcmD family protein
MIWLGIVFYLFRIDSKLTKLEKMMLDSESESSEN